MSSIFLSHNHRDKPFVRRLSERLQAHGIRTWVDEAEMRIGDSLISKVEAAIKEFNYLGVILSPDSVKSDWVRKEVNIALTKEIQGKRVKVLPLLYKFEILAKKMCRLLANLSQVAWPRRYSPVSFLFTHLWSCYETKKALKFYSKHRVIFPSLVTGVLGPVAAII